MPCPLCGDICRCSSDLHSAASPRWLADDDALLAASSPHDMPETPGADVARPGPAADAAPPDSNDGDQSAAREDSAA
ncbi:MAG: hypothetical protein WA899_02905, partial [Candidatus Sulfotelmatobacter sp.]